MEIGSKRWIIRRKIVFTILIFAALVITYLMIFGKDTRLNEAIVNGIFGFASAAIGLYFGFSTWDDKNLKLKN